MPIHPQFLIHWTCSSVQDADPPDRFIQRLEETTQDGLQMRLGPERIHGRDGKWVECKCSRVCLSEVRLSQATLQASRYGKLGIGLDREFVLGLGGNPALYVQNGDNGVIVECMDLVGGAVKNEDVHRQLGIICSYSRTCQTVTRTTSFTTRSVSGA